MEHLNEFKKFISQPRKCVIVMHTKPDADALGSSLGLAGYLTKKGHSVQVIAPTDYPDFLKWMKGNDDVWIYKGGRESESEQAVQGAEAIFCLDFSSLNRIDQLGDQIRESKATKILIDHHLDPEDFADYMFWSTEAAATAQLVFQLIDDLGDKNLIDSDDAESLYAGIMTDTGSFRHSSTTAEVFEISGQLVHLGADVNKVSRKVYDANSFSRLQLIGFALSQRLTILNEFRTAFFYLSAEDLDRYQYQTGDSEGLVNYGLSIKNIVMAVTIIEREDGVKMSFRSVGKFSVNDFAREHFNGGGHRNAAGGRSGDSLEETVRRFESLLPKYREALISEV